MSLLIGNLSPSKFYILAKHKILILLLLRIKSAMMDEYIFTCFISVSGRNKSITRRIVKPLYSPTSLYCCFYFSVVLGTHVTNSGY